MAIATRESKIVWSSDISKVASDYKRLQAEQDKTAAGIARITKESQREEAQALKTSRARNKVREQLAISPSGRAAARAGGTGAFADAAASLSFARFRAAQLIKGQRYVGESVRRDADRQGVLSMAGGSRYSPDVNAWAQRELRKRKEMADFKASADLEQFGSRMAADRSRKEKSLASRNEFAQGALAVGAAVTGIAAAADAKLTQYADKLVSTEDTLSGLYGVGQNPMSRRQIRQSAIAGSIGGGISLESMADLRGRMASAFGDMDAATSGEAESAALKFGKLGVKDRTSTALGLGALHGTFGDQLGGGAPAMRLLANRLALSADVGAFDPDTVTPYLASMGQAFKGSGYKDTDMFAATALASKSGMRAEAFTTGVRNLPLLLMEGQKKGFKQTGNFAQDMGQLSKMESPELLDLVGRDVFVVAKMFADNNATLREYIAAQEALTSKVDTLGTKIAQSFTDSAFATAETIKSARQVVENAPAIQAGMPWMQDAITDLEIRKAGAAATSNPLTSWFDPATVWMESAGLSLQGGLDQEGVRNSKGQLYAAGISQMISAKRQSKDDIGADYLTLTGGYDTQSYYTGADGKRKYTGKAEAEEFVDMRAKGGYDDLSANEYTQYKQMTAAGNTKEADKYLKDVGKSAAQAAKDLADAAKTLKQTVKDPNARR